MPPETPCPVCDHPGTVAFLHRARVPVHQNFLYDSVTEARAACRGQLRLHVCPGCGFVFNAAFQPELLDYGRRYENTQTWSPAFAVHVADLAEELLTRRGVRNCRIVEVGCGKGGFLRLLVARPEDGNVGVGFDPSYLGPATDLDGLLQFHTSFYGPETAVPADVVVCRHVIEHIERPLALLGAVRAALDSAPHARVFFETPCVEWIIRHQVTWDLFYEHCSLFTLHSLALAFERRGFVTRQVRHVFGGQYLWLEAAVGQSAQSPTRPLDIGPALEFGRRQEQEQRRWQAFLTGFRPAPLVWGAGAKGVTFCNLADPQCRFLAGVVDVNPAKQGKFIAGTGHPILAPEALPGLGGRAILVLNPLYRDEIAEKVRQLGLRAPVVDLMNQKEIAA